MPVSIQDQIHTVISKTKAHKDAFAIPKLIQLLEAYLEGVSHKSGSEIEERVLLFVKHATEALMASPIYSDTLLRDLYRSALDVAAASGIRRESLLEDLLFQSLRRPVDPERGKRKKQPNARKRIIEAALDEFSDRGFHATTIDSIADRAGIAKGTVYRYFKTKEVLFNALKEDTTTEFIELARRDLGREKDVLRIIESIIRIYLAFFEKNSAIFKVIVQEQKDFGREFSEKFINELIMALPGLKRRCWQASRTGHLKQMNYFTVFYGIIGFLNGIIQKWLHEGAEGSLLDDFETVKEVLFYGVATQAEQSPQGKGNNLRVIS